MPSILKLARLFRAIADRDLPSAHGVAAEIAAHEERIGHRRAAQTLIGSLRPNGSVASAGTSGPQLSAVNVLLSDALTPLPPSPGIDQVQLRPASRSALADIRLEWEHRTSLAHAGFPRRSRLLFYGPPGCGKSMTAGALASSFGLPAYVVRFDAVVGAYLGQTAGHLREIFRFAEATPCVLLLDEIDALGKHRGDPTDIGELHRIAITLMQELEHARPSGYVIATSNLPEQLDRALWRRFDLTLSFPRPRRRELESFSKKRAGEISLSLTNGLKTQLYRSPSYATAETLLLDEARRRILVSLSRS